MACRWCANRKPDSAFRGLLRRYKRDAKRRGLSFDLTETQFRSLVLRPCFYCGAAPSQKGARKFREAPFIYNGIDRVDNGEGYGIENVVPCCGVCNYLKKNVTVAMARKIVEFINASVAQRSELSALNR